MAPFSANSRRGHSIGSDAVAYEFDEVPQRLLLHGLSSAGHRWTSSGFCSRIEQFARSATCPAFRRVRFHLKQLFAKTSTRRQSELVRVLLTTAQVQATPE
jgi:hypothetical protein